MSGEHILIVDDEPAIQTTLRGVLEDEGYRVTAVGNGADALRVVADEPPDLTFLDIWMERMDGLETLAEIKRLRPEALVVMISGHGTIETAVKAEIIGESEPVRRLREQIATAAPTTGRVLIRGENGSGKELVARAIHAQSARRERPFVEVNCAAIPEELIESELFGHEKGAFTGALARRRGKFELADGGTLFLDEIGDMSLKTQAKVLRALEEQAFERVGGKDTIRVDVRVIAASNRDLETLIREGRFRDDLYYRLNVIPIEVPPLRAKKDDIPVLVDHFIALFCAENGKRPRTVSGEALGYFLAYDWPGNVRELRNMVERLVIMTRGDVIGADDLPAPLRPKAAVPAGEASERSLREARENFERAYILAELRANDWNMTRTSERLGIERSHLYRKLKAYNITPPRRDS